MVVEQPADQPAAAVHLQLAIRIGFQLADGGREVTGQDGRARPFRLVSVVDATYVGRVFNAAAMGLVLGSAITPQERAKISLTLGH